MLNTNGVFISDFKATNDFSVVLQTSDPVAVTYDTFGGSSSANNPAYLANFVGAASNGTGDGTAGDLADLDMTSDASGAVQFDFAIPMTPLDRILVVDVDGPEQYLFQASFVNETFDMPVSTAGWAGQPFAGTVGSPPDSRWPTWNASAGTLVSGTSENINEELFVLTPNQNFNRLVVTKLSTGASGWSTDITFVSLGAPLAIQKTDSNVVLTWGSADFGLQAASDVGGPYTNLPAATSPYTNAISGSHQFFRLAPQ